MSTFAEKSAPSPLNSSSNSISTSTSRHLSTTLDAKRKSSLHAFSTDKLSPLPRDASGYPMGRDSLDPIQVSSSSRSGSATSTGNGAATISNSAANVRERSRTTSIQSTKPPTSYIKKERKALYGESFDPTALRTGPKKLIRKSDKSRGIIANALLSHFLFSRLPDREIITLVDAMEEFTFPIGTSVITQGSEGDYFYVVENGGFAIIVDENVVGEVAFEGGTFGELALMHNSPRAATITVTQGDKQTNNAKLWGLDRNTFRGTLAATSLQGIDDVKKFLENVKILEGLDSTQMSTLAQAVDVKTYNKGELIVKRGDVGNEMFVIKEGDVVCKVQKDEKDSKLKSKEIDINLSRGDYFGERALLYHETRAASVFCTSATCTCYTISISVFNMILGSLKDLLEMNLRHAYLKTLDLFKGLDQACINSVAKVLIPMEFEEDDEIICKGYKSDHFFLIRTGKLTLTANNDQVVSLSSGDCFGEESLIPGSKAYSMTVSASCDCECLVLMSSSLVELGIRFNAAAITRLMSASESRYLMDGKETFFVAPHGIGSSDVEVDEITNQLLLKLDSGSDRDQDELDDIFDSESLNFPKMNVATVDELTTGRTLGTGSFGRVKVAKHNTMNIVFALKILQKYAIKQTRQEKNIINEKDLTNVLVHPFILHLYGTFQDRDCLYMMLEIVMGGELFRLLHGDGSVNNLLSLEDTAFYAGTVSSVYEYIHAQNIVYRDLKPENILIGRDGYLKIVDWGFAKKVIDKTFTTCGTPEYLAPELVQGTGHSKGVDYWALGILVYEMVVGKTPFVGSDAEDTMAICRNIMNESIIYPEGFDDNLMDLIDGLCTREVLARLGCMRGGASDVLEHPFFGDINWKDLKEKKLMPPWIPTIKGETDMRNFDDIYDGEEEIIVEYDGDQEVFKSF